MSEKKPEELEALERAFKTLIVMPQCSLTIVIVTTSYLKGYFMGEPDIVTQVKLSQQLGHPTILLLDQDLTPNERKQAETIFKNHNVVAKITFDPNNIRKCYPELFEALKPMELRKVKLETKIRRFREGRPLYISGDEWNKAAINGLLCGIVGCRNKPKWKCPTCKHFYCGAHKGIHQRIHPP